MKKLLIALIAAVFCLGMTLPAMAKVHMGGIIFTDFWYQDMDKENSGTGDDAARTEIQVPNITRLYGKWTNDDKTVGMHIEFGIDGNGVRERGLVTRHAYGWWQATPVFKITAGQTETGLSPLNPHQLLGLEGGRLNVVGVGFGNLYSGRIPLVKFDITPTDMFGLTVSLAENGANAISAANADVITGATVPGFGAYGAFPAEAGKTVSEESKLPRLDVSAHIKAGPVTIYPGFMYAEKTFENVASGNDDSIETWAASLGFKGGFGPVGFAAEGNIGQNWGNQDFLGTGVENATCAWAYVDASGNNKISDTDMLGYWGDLSFKAGPATIHLLYGAQHFENDDVNVSGNDFEQKTQMYGVSVPIAVAKTFIIRPEFMMYDLGDKEWPGADVDRGKYGIYGVQFQIVF